MARLKHRVVFMLLFTGTMTIPTVILIMIMVIGILVMVIVTGMMIMMWSGNCTVRSVSTAWPKVVGSS